MIERDILTALYLLAFLALVHYAHKLWARKRSRMPPGPLPLPIFGNIFDLPRIKPWEVYRELSVKYGACCRRQLSDLALESRTGSELLFMDLPNQPTIVLNSTNSILALMEGHAKTYSSKAETIMDGM